MAANEVTIHVNVNDDTSSGLSRVRASVDAMTGRLSTSSRRGGAGIGGSLVAGVQSGVSAAAPSASTSIGSAITDMFRGGLSNPTVLAGIAALVALLAPAIAAVLGSAIILGIGGAMTGVGILLLAQTNEWKGKIDKTFSGISKTMTEAFQPLSPVLGALLDIAQQLSDHFAPIIKKLSEKVAPHLVDFLTAIGDAIADIPEATWDQIADAFIALLDAFADIAPDVIQSIAQSLADMAVAISDNAPEIAQLFEALIDLLPAVLDFLTALIQALPIVLPIILQMIGSFEWVVATFKDVMTWGRQMWTKVSGYVGNLKDDVSAAWTWLVKNVFNPISNFFTKTIPSAAKTLWQKVTGAFETIKEKLGAAKDWIKGKIDAIVGFFAAMPGKITKAAKGMFDGVKNAFKDAINWIIGKWNGLSLTLSIPKVHIPLLGDVGGGSFTLSTPNIPKLATGGISGGGLAMVGENGPELVRLPSGSSVMNNGATERALSGGNGNNRIVLEINAAGNDTSKMLVEILKNAIRVRGGDVQVVLGK